MKSIVGVQLNLQYYEMELYSENTLHVIIKADFRSIKFSVINIVAGNVRNMIKYQLCD